MDRFNNKNVRFVYLEEPEIDKISIGSIGEITGGDPFYARDSLLTSISKEESV